jgi:hypothetical protein
MVQKFAADFSAVKMPRLAFRVQREFDDMREPRDTRVDLKELLVEAVCVVVPSDCPVTVDCFVSQPFSCPDRCVEVSIRG